jgi:pimeloyl-ACP methyl ester carboxylesterase
MMKVISTDGTAIAFDRTGTGPAIILVDGALCSRGFGPMPKLAPLLAPHFTVFTYDRRGRGDSGNTAPYAVAREVEDIDALIKEAGGSALVFGHSSGAALALEAAASGLSITKLGLYEPPFMVDEHGPRPPADHQAQLERLISAGRRGDAVKFFLSDMVNVPAIFVFIMQLTPAWSKLKAVARFQSEFEYTLQWSEVASSPARRRAPSASRTQTNNLLTAAASRLAAGDVSPEL